MAVILVPPGPKAVEKEERAPAIEDVKDKVETYPAVPNPATVEVMAVILVPPGPKAVEKEDRAALIEDVKDNVETYPIVPRPATVDVITGVERNPDIWRPRVVETKDKEETYPAVPNPATVDVMLAILVPPGPNAVEKEERAPAIDDVKDKVET